MYIHPIHTPRSPVNAPVLLVSVSQKTKKASIRRGRPCWTSCWYTWAMEPFNRATCSEMKVSGLPSLKKLRLFAYCGRKDCGGERGTEDRRM